MECDNVCEPAQPEVDNNDRGDGGNAIAPASPAAESSVSDPLIFVSALKQDFSLCSGLERSIKTKIETRGKAAKESMEHA